MDLQLSSPLTQLKGIGKTRLEQYEKLGISTVLDLLSHFPRNYLDCTHPSSILAAPFGAPVVVRATVFEKEGVRRISGNRKLQKVLVVDDTGLMTLTFFNNIYAADRLKIGEEYLFYGRISNNFSRREMNSPQIFDLSEAGQFLPVYRLTKGLSNRMISSHVKEALNRVSFQEDLLPALLRDQYSLPDQPTATRDIHFPSSPAALTAARNRFVFEELLILQLALQAVRLKSKEKTKAVTGDYTPFLNSLPFTLTDAQRKALSEAAADLAKEESMARLIQGDVGSGKTVVAAALCYLVAMAGRQAVLLAPTEILATQHAATLTSLFETSGISVELLTGGLSSSEKRETNRKIASGEAKVIVGTHALLQKTVNFSDLALVITDEQHRFGVEQRSALTKKGEHPHLLVMSATPIPRSLALAIYGELSISVIDTLPKGRKPVQTYRIDSAKRARLFAFANKALARGEQVYIVCPTIGEEEELSDSLRDVHSEYQELAGAIFPKEAVGLLHGKLSPAQKEAVMADFVANKIKVLISTTVIEVGVDVPNATLMIIENAERFGLSQLHQLRGRVGRGEQQSTCVLISDDPGEQTLKRLDTLCKTTDGFEIATADLEQRGPGDFLGNRQHGLPEFKVADLANDLSLVEAAGAEAKALIASGEMKNYPLLRQAVKKQLSRLEEGRIS